MSLQWPPLFILVSDVRVSMTELAKDLIKILQEARQVVPPTLMEIASFGGGGGGRGGGYRGGGGGVSAHHHACRRV